MASQRRKLFLVMIIGGGIFIIFAGLLMAKLGRSTTTVETPTPTIVIDMQRISVEEAKAAFDKNEALFVDVRDSNSYETSHIPGAVLVSLSDLVSQFSGIDKSRWIITYCSWMEEESSARAALILVQNGYSHVTPIQGGFDAWVASGYQVESGK